MTQLGWRSSRILAEFQKLKTDPLSLLYNLDTLSMEKLRVFFFFAAAPKSPLQKKTNLVILCLEEKKGQTPLSSEQLYRFNVYANNENFGNISARLTWQLHYYSRSTVPKWDCARHKNAQGSIFTFYRMFQIRWHFSHVYWENMGLHCTNETFSTVVACTIYTGMLVWHIYLYQVISLSPERTDTRTYLNTNQGLPSHELWD